MKLTQLVHKKRDRGVAFEHRKHGFFKHDALRSSSSSVRVLSEQLSQWRRGERVKSVVAAAAAALTVRSRRKELLAEFGNERLVNSAGINLLSLTDAPQLDCVVGTARCEILAVR